MVRTERETGFKRMIRWTENTFHLTFDVSVDDHVAVQVAHTFQYLPRVFTRDVFRQSTVRLQLVFNWSLRKTKSKENGS